MLSQIIFSAQILIVSRSFLNECTNKARDIKISNWAQTVAVSEQFWAIILQWARGWIAFLLTVENWSQQMIRKWKRQLGIWTNSHSKEGIASLTTLLKECCFTKLVIVECWCLEFCFFINVLGSFSFCEGTICQLFIHILKSWDGCTPKVLELVERKCNRRLVWERKSVFYLSESQLFSNRTEQDHKEYKFARKCQIASF